MIISKKTIYGVVITLIMCTVLAIDYFYLPEISSLDIYEHKVMQGTDLQKQAFDTCVTTRYYFKFHKIFERKEIDRPSCKIKAFNY